MKHWLWSALVGLAAVVIGVSGALDASNPSWQRVLFLVGLAVMLCAYAAAALRKARTARGRG